ncbi:hypothetical protein [Weissella cibaria]|uniref:hypothetical protein n=1 Tax=Weissella cibaria TaxID=137591 RepID=UPI001898E446|nr:hypothetical protein [Weissella cibaria]
MTNEQFDNCSRLKLDQGMYSDFGRMSRYLVTGLLMVEDADEQYRWTVKLLG